MSGTLYVTTLATALCCGLVAGVWFAFSAFVMGGLERLPSHQGIAAMQSINRVAVTPLFMTALFGTAVLCLGLAVWTVVAPEGRGAALVVGAGALYLIGTIGVTIVANVPLNNRLEALRPEDGAAPHEWDRYVSRWTAWNHVRGITSLGAAALLTIALTED